MCCYGVSLPPVAALDRHSNLHITTHWNISRVHCEIKIHSCPWYNSQAQLPRSTNFLRLYFPNCWSLNSLPVAMCFGSLMKGFSSQSLVCALKSLTVHSLSYSSFCQATWKVSYQAWPLLLSQLLACSDIHHSCGQKAPENYQRAWRRERDIGSFHNEWGEKALSRLQVSQYFFLLSDMVWWHLEDHTAVNHLLLVSSWPLCCTVLKVPQIALWYLYLLYSLNSGSVQAASADTTHKLTLGSNSKSTGILGSCYMRQ